MRRPGVASSGRGRPVPHIVAAVRKGAAVGKVLAALQEAAEAYGA
jgi:hypothetical protein